MRNFELYTLKAVAQAKAAGDQNTVVQCTPHGFRADVVDRMNYWKEKDVEAGMWEAQRRSASVATALFLREHGCSTLTGKERRARKS